MQTSQFTKITSRPFRDDQDFWRIRNLSIETYPISGLGWNWEIRHWDGSRFYNENPELNPDWKDEIHLWETSEGKLIGVVNQDGHGWFFLQLHPGFRQIEEEMIAWAEEHFSVPVAGTNQHQVHLEVFEYDTPRQEILTRRGYEKQSYGGITRRMRLDTDRPLPEIHLAEEYFLRTIRPDDLEDCQRLADLLNAAFNRTFHCAEEFHQFARRAPCFNPDLHLVAEAPDGSFAAHVAVIYDEANRRALYEPVCTHPNHRRKNLSQTLMYEGMRRVKALGACELTVETGDMIPANALYNSIGFTEVAKSYDWRKVFSE